jgi:hypothetical protein
MARSGERSGESGTERDGAGRSGTERDGAEGRREAEKKKGEEGWRRERVGKGKSGEERSGEEQLATP